MTTSSRMAASPHEREAMHYAFELARNGPRGVNPQVGAVILSPDGDILAEGWHRGAGTAHAEVDALDQLGSASARGATIVVTLEPCNHDGRTGPCTQALIDAGIARVLYAVADPGAESSGGAERMRAAGLEVIGEIYADEGEELLESWLMVQRLGRPHITVKWAQSLDGRAAAADGSSQWITGPQARVDVHRRRAEADAIVVGTGTVLADDPALTARDEDGQLLPAQPIPVVIGERPLPLDATLWQHPNEPIEYHSHDLHEAVQDLRRRGIQRIFVEGGPTLASAFIRAGLADDILSYVAPILLGGDRLALHNLGISTLTQAHRLTLVAVDQLGDDLLIHTQLNGAD